jgi:hypothetical protein
MAEPGQWRFVWELLQRAIWEPLLRLASKLWGVVTFKAEAAGEVQDAASFAAKVVIKDKAGKDIKHYLKDLWSTFILVGGLVSADVKLGISSCMRLTCYH